MLRGVWRTRRAQVESVVAYLPPPEGTEPTWALFFQRGDYAWALEAPLAELLAPTPPESPALMTPAEVAVVDELTTPVQFRYSFYETNLDETVLGLARDAGQITRFSYEPPSLSDIFNEAVTS